MKLKNETGEITVNYYKDHNQDYVVETELWYPLVKEPDCVSSVTIDLIDVRAAPPIKVCYDFERDGYVIYRQDDLPFPLEGDGSFWVEKAFVSAND